MAASAAQKAALRRMTAEPTEETYSDAALATMIETYPLVDARGEEPLIESETTPGTLEANPDWVATYDLAAAAADIWAEKAGALAADYDYQADGGRFDRSQAYEQAMKQSRFYRARRSPSTVTLVPVPLQQGSEDIEE
ncbi:MAG: hypothetical protein HY825_13560 [Acidobacteria bacterium]|nr:hypothetical protein [Acidobacteriota bacterium]